LGSSLNPQNKNQISQACDLLINELGYEEVMKLKPWLKIIPVKRTEFLLFGLKVFNFLRQLKMPARSTKTTDNAKINWLRARILLGRIMSGTL
jgi:hypothetical protein